MRKMQKAMQRNRDTPVHGTWSRFRTEKKLFAKETRVGDVYSEGALKNIFIEEIETSIRNSAGRYREARSHADLTNLDFETQSLLAMQGGSRKRALMPIANLAQQKTFDRRKQHRIAVNAVVSDSWLFCSRRMHARQARSGSPHLWAVQKRTEAVHWQHQSPFPHYQFHKYSDTIAGAAMTPHACCSNVTTFRTRHFQKLLWQAQYTCSSISDVLGQTEITSPNRIPHIDDTITTVRPREWRKRKQKFCKRRLALLTLQRT